MRPTADKKQTVTGSQQWLQANEKPILPGRILLVDILLVKEDEKHDVIPDDTSRTLTKLLAGKSITKWRNCGGPGSIPGPDMSVSGPQFRMEMTWSVVKSLHSVTPTWIKTCKYPIIRGKEFGSAIRVKAIKSLYPISLHSILPVLWIRIHFFRIRIRIQSVQLETNTDPDPDSGSGSNTDPGL